MSSSASRLLKGLLLAFCCGHSVFLVMAIVPEPAPRDDRGNPAVDLYRLALGGRQQWTVFETIPLQHSLDVWLEDEDKTRGQVTAGCVLPGFKPYPVPEKSRYYELLYSMMFFIDDFPYREAYMRKLAQFLAARRGSGARGKWSIVTAAGYTRNLFYSKRDGQLSMMLPKTFDLPIPVGSSQ